jgi:hypothetical protein
VFVAADGQLVSFNGRLPNPNSSLNRVWTTKGDGTSLAIDEAGRRVFMAHEEGSTGAGVISEFSIADPNAPWLVAEHAVPLSPDPRLVAFDPVYRRLYVVDDNGRITRTGPDDRIFTEMANRQEGPGGILVDPSTGGVWVSIRSSANGKLARIYETGAFRQYVLTGYAQPRGMAWDVLVPGTLLVAIDSDTQGRVIRVTPSSGAIAQVMNTDPRPQDVGVSAQGARVSVNRRASGIDGTMTKDGAFLAYTYEKPVALLVHELPRLTAEPPNKSFCYQNTGNTGEQTFAIQNTRLDGQPIDLVPIAIGGANPANYRLVGTNTCAAARLSWGQSCTFRVRFTAGGPSVQPPPPPNVVQFPSWPAEAVVSGTAGSAATTRIPLKATRLLLGSCHGLPPLIPTSPIQTGP